MEIEMAAVAIAALGVSAWLTWQVRKMALAHGVLDMPNERSSHAVPTPRGGGVAIVVAATAAFVILGALHILDRELLLALTGGGLAVAVVGFIDDRRPLSARLRLAVHFGAALWALGWLGGLPPVRIGEHLVSWGWAGQLIGAVCIVWILNLFNFMDGIDGIAGSEAVFVTGGGAALAFVAGMSLAVPAAALVLGAACCGFLLWNWPPAKIFMGDVGSGYVGYVLAVLALAATRESPTALWIWLLLGGVFFADTTVTLVYRLGKRERLSEAHRSHAYQRLSRRWRSHLRVTCAVLLVNVSWLLPAAWLATVHPGCAAWVALAALVPLIILTSLLGAGRPDPV